MPDIDSVGSELDDVESSAGKARGEIETATQLMDSAESDGLTQDDKDEILDALGRARTALNGPRPLADIIKEIGEVEAIWQKMETVEPEDES